MRSRREKVAEKNSQKEKTFPSPLNFPFSSSPFLILPIKSLSIHLFQITWHNFLWTILKNYHVFAGVEECKKSLYRSYPDISNALEKQYL